MWRKLRALVFCVALLWSGTIRRAQAGGLERWRERIVADRADARRTDGIRITYLGTNGYLFETAGSTLLVDPYITRVPLSAVLLETPIASDPNLVADIFAPLPRRIDAILVTHGHFDHLLDTPEIMRRTGARLVASQSSVNLVVAHGQISPTRCSAVEPGNVFPIGPWKVRVLGAEHDRVFGILPFPGNRTATMPRPRRAADWRMGEPLAFLIETAGRRIYIDSGGVPCEDLPPADIGRVNLAIVGAALPDARRRLPPLLRRLHPDYFLPSHQDNFFRPLTRGFSFGPLTNFPAVQRASDAGQLSGKLILLDYFRPWTLR